jgi:glycosyltransferase involved in cell wall biosynthesis
MRIAIDARELSGKPTGVGRYLAEILREWAGMDEALAHEFILCAPAPVPYAGGLQVTQSIQPGRSTWWEQLTLPRLAGRADADVLFCPAYSGPVFPGVPLIVAVHDVSFAAHPEWFRWREGLRRRLLTRASARRATRVLTLTHFSKQEISDHLSVPPERIDVINPGVVRQPFDVRPSGDASNVVEAPTAAEPLLLYVGSIFNRRHVPETIRGFERLAKRRPEVRFTIVGDNRTFPRIEIEEVVKDHERVAFVRYAPDAMVARLYSQARAFVFLSEYEGFGLTPLEALAARVPIVVLDTAVSREVYGEAAIYVGDPAPRAVEAALETALFDDTTRSQVLQAAAAIVARYSWNACARQVLAALVAAG